MHSSFILALIVALASVVAHAQGNSTNSTTSPSLPTLSMRPAECIKKLKLMECLGTNLNETVPESEWSSTLKNTVCASECTNTLTQMSRSYVESQCGKDVRLGFDLELMMPIMPTLSKFMCTTDSQGSMCAALMMSAFKQSGVNRTVDRSTKRAAPAPIEKFPKSFTCSECAGKIQEAARAADADAKAKSSAGKNYWIDSAFPFDDAAVDARKSLCPAGAASATDATKGGSNSAGRNSGLGATSAAVLVAVAALALA